MSLFSFSIMTGSIYIQKSKNKIGVFFFMTANYPGKMSPRSVYTTASMNLFRISPPLEKWLQQCLKNRMHKSKVGDLSPE